MMMEFETWNRDRLIKEVNGAIALDILKPQANSFDMRLLLQLCNDKELRKKTDYELRNLYVKFKMHDKSFSQAYKENEERKRFFNQPTCDADFGYWSKQAYWTIDEAIALVLGKDPRRVTWDNIKPYLQNSPFANRFSEIRELARRYVSCNQLFESVYPGIFLAWAKRMSIDIPNQLHENVTAVGIQICDWQTLFKQAEEIIQLKDQTIQFLTQERDLLKSENADLTELSQLELDPESEHYPSELDTANIIYRTVLNNRDKTLSFKEQAKKILDKDYPNLSQEAKERIAVVINPDKQKSGGRKKSTP